MTGFLPHETKVVKNQPLPKEVETIAEILSERGYRTAAVISNYILRAGQGFEQGFELYDVEMDQSESVRGTPERTASQTTDRAIEVLEMADDRPLFFWVHYQDPHGPYTPPGSYAERYQEPEATARELPFNNSINGFRGIPRYQRLGEQNDYHFYSARYDGEIRYLDFELGRLFAALKRLGHYDHALIVFTADHGESMGEHEFYFMHGQHLYGDAIRVPLILRYGDSLNGRRADFVQHLDLLPTVREVLGLDPDDRLRGGDLRQPQPADREIVSLMSYTASLIRDGFKFINTPKRQRLELFDLVSDPGELKNLATLPEHEPRMREMAIRLGEIFQENRLDLAPTAPAPAPAPTADELEKLRALGYVD
jgi:arylsulfatase A-like enzyme